MTVERPQGAFVSRASQAHPDKKSQIPESLGPPQRLGSRQAIKPHFSKDPDMTMLSNIPHHPLATSRNQSSVGSFLVWLGRLVDHLVAAAIARHERQAQLVALHQFSDRELKDIGICRGEIDYGLDEAAKTRARQQRINR
jgi:uncharacterized protein YjiS (DUF1127 family)